MRVAYSISLKDFRSLQPAFTLRTKRSTIFKTILIPCAMTALAGAICLWQGSALAIVGGLLVALGGSLAVFAYLFERRSVRDKRAQYEFGVMSAFENLHCRDERVIEVGENGFRFMCKCGEVIRPWSELQRFSEHESAFVIGTKTETHLVPKSAFPSEGAMTEFRAAFRERIEQGRTMVAQLIDFKYERKDYRNAVILHIISGGGWRLLAKILLGLGVWILVAVAVWDFGKAHGATFSVVGGGVGVMIYRFLKNPRKPKYLGTQRVFIEASGIQVEDHCTAARIPWNQFAGYLEDKNVLLLYYTSGRYRLIPKRALASRESEIRSLIREHLPRFNYRISQAASVS